MSPVFLELVQTYVNHKICPIHCYNTLLSTIYQYGIIVFTKSIFCYKLLKNIEHILNIIGNTC